MAEAAARRLLCLLAALCAWAALARPALAADPDPLDLIRQRGSIVVGVKQDYPLFGQVGADGRLQGLEVDLATALAERLGVAAQIVAVSAANRLTRLEDGSVDLVIATLGDTEQRRSIATLLEPNYYASGVNLMVPPNITIRDWAELRGRPVCATQGSYFNRLIAERYLADLQVFGSNRDAKLAVGAGRCVGWAYDDTAIAGDLLTAEWAGWRMPLTSALVTPWAMALRRSAQDSRLHRSIEDILGGWHRDGTLVAMEARWGIPPSAFLRRQHDLWQAHDAQGELVCQRSAIGQWPDACRNRALLVSTEATGLMRLGLLVKERTGLDFSIVYDGYDRASFGLGLFRTLLLVAGSTLGALALGVAAAMAVDRRLPLLTPLLGGLVTVLRMTPPLLQIYVVFFGLGGWLAGRFGLLIDPMLTALLCLSAYAGAAVAQALADAALALARTRPDFRIGRATLRAVLFAARGAIVGILVNIAKATGMASVIAAPEIISAATAVMAERGNVTVMMNLLMATYFLIILGVVLLLDRVNRAIDRRLAEVGPPAPQGA